MIDSLFDKNTMKKFDNLASKQAKLDYKKNMLTKKTMEKMEAETMVKVLDVVENYGHPNEKLLSNKIKEKYFAGEELEFTDLLNLDNLYKSNYQKFQKRDAKDE